jgi:hypothetical protein
MGANDASLFDIFNELLSNVFWVSNAFPLEGPTSSTADKVAHGIAFSDTRLAKLKAILRRLRH